MLRPGEPYLRGRPLDIDFLGFRSDTYRLQQAGWQFAEERSEYRDEIRIAIRHPEHRISGMSGPVTRGQVFTYIRRDWDRRPDTVRIELAIQYMIHEHPRCTCNARFVPVDTTPSYEVFGADDLYDMPYFKPIDEGKEIFLRKASVEEIMQIALDKQEPEQARIRASRQADRKREEYNRGGTTKAKLIMVA